MEYDYQQVYNKLVENGVPKAHMEFTKGYNNKSGKWEGSIRFIETDDIDWIKTDN